MQSSNRIEVTYHKTETAEKEMQDASCRESGGAPQFKEVPLDWGIRGLIKTISAFSLYKLV